LIKFLSIIPKQAGHFVIKLGLHGLHFSWLIFIYFVANQQVKFILSSYNGLHVNPLRAKYLILYVE